MKARTLRSSFVAALVLGVSLTGIVSAGGCKSSTEKARGEARSAASELRSNLPKMSKNIDETINSLMTLTAGNNTNRAKSFQEFSSHFSWMQSRAREIGEQADRATADSQAYFRDWTGDAMKSRSAADRKAAEDSIATRRASVDTALAYLKEGRAKYQGLADNLRDLQNTLRGNLGQTAIDAAGPAVQKAIAQANDVKNYISRLSEQIDATLGIK